MNWYKITALPSEETVKPSWMVLVIQGRVAAFSAPVAVIGEEWTFRLAIYEKNGWQVEVQFSAET